MPARTKMPGRRLTGSLTPTSAGQLPGTIRGHTPPDWCAYGVLIVPDQISFPSRKHNYPTLALGATPFRSVQHGPFYGDIVCRQGGVSVDTKRAPPWLE